MRGTNKLGYRTKSNSYSFLPPSNTQPAPKHGTFIPAEQPFQGRGGASATHPHNHLCIMLASNAKLDCKLPHRQQASASITLDVHLDRKTHRTNVTEGPPTHAPLFSAAFKHCGKSWILLSGSTGLSANGTPKKIGLTWLQAWSQKSLHRVLCCPLRAMPVDRELN